MTRNELKRQEQAKKQTILELARQAVKLASHTGISLNFCSKMVLRQTMMRMGNGK